MPGKRQPQQDDSPTGLAPRLPVKQLLVVLSLVATAYAGALLVGGTSSRFPLAGLWSLAGVQAAGLCLLSYGLRGLRWRMWIGHYGRHFGLLQGLRLYLAGYAFTPTPGNVGEAIRGLMLVHAPLNTRQSLSIFGAERLADLLCLLLLCMPAAAWAWEQGAIKQLPGWLSSLLLAGGFAALLAGSALFRFRHALLLRFGWLREAWACLSLQPLIWLGLTLAAWAAQGVAVWLICGQLGLSLGLLTATGFYAVAMVGGALSALPAGLGGTEAVLTGLLVAYGASPGSALETMVVVRLLTLWLAVAIGLLALLYSAAIARDISFR